MSPSSCYVEVEIKVLNPIPELATIYAHEARKQLERRRANLMAAQEEAENRDAAYVSYAREGHFFHTPAMTLAQLKAVTAALAQSFSPPTPGGMLVDIDGGDMILPIVDGEWKGHYLSWNARWPEKHLPYPEPCGSHFIIGRDSGRLCWWTLKP